MNKRILVIYNDIRNKNKLKKILIKSNILNKCTFATSIFSDFLSYDIILTHINDFKNLAEMKIILRKETNLPVINIIDKGELELFDLLEDHYFKIIKFDFSFQSSLKNEIKDFQNLFNDTIHLTNREKEVLDLICKGTTIDEISLMLGISSKTVISHKRNLFMKTNVHSINQLMLWSFNRI